MRISPRLICSAVVLISVVVRGATVTGTVVDENGNPVVALVRFIPQGAGPASVVDVTSTSTGTFAAPNITGSVEICIQAPGKGYVNPCLWPSSRIIAPSVSSQAALQLTVKKGAAVTIQVTDPSGVLASNGSAPLLVGVFAPGGMYYPADLIAKGQTGRSYSLTIPYGIGAQLFIHSPFFVIADSTGQPIATSGLSLPFLQNTSAQTATALVFSITGKKN